MIVNKYKILLPKNDEEINIPIEINWDLLDRSDSLIDYEQETIKSVINQEKDFEVARFAHSENPNSLTTDINYEFYFAPSGATTANTVWSPSYVVQGFTPYEVYYYSNSFDKSFFKLDLYDSLPVPEQTNYITIILPVQQGDFETVTISSSLSNVKIRKPRMGLDFIGDKEGFFIYWLRKRTYIDKDEFYMSAKFFNGKTGTFTRMMNRPQSTLLGNYYTFNSNDYFYYKVKLNYDQRNYQATSTVTNNRVGDEINPISWYEYVNP